MLVALLLAGIDYSAGDSITEAAIWTTFAIYLASQATVTTLQAIFMAGAKAYLEDRRESA